MNATRIWSGLGALVIALWLFLRAGLVRLSAQLALALLFGLALFGQFALALLVAVIRCCQVRSPESARMRGHRPM